VTCAIGMTCAIGILSFLSNASGMRATIGVWNRLGFVSDFRIPRLDLVNHGSSTTTTVVYRLSGFGTRLSLPLPFITALSA
jgi:hypothetical protein